MIHLKCAVFKRFSEKDEREGNRRLSEVLTSIHRSSPVSEERVVEARERGLEASTSVSYCHNNYLNDSASSLSPLIHDTPSCGLTIRLTGRDLSWVRCRQAKDAQQQRRMSATCPLRQRANSAFGLSSAE